MIKWIKIKMEESKDINIIWKAVVMHHPIFELKTQESNSILNDLLQLLKYY